MPNEQVPGEFQMSSYIPEGDAMVQIGRRTLRRSSGPSARASAGPSQQGYGAESRATDLTFLQTSAGIAQVSAILS